MKKILGLAVMAVVLACGSTGHGMVVGSDLQPAMTVAASPVTMESSERQLADDITRRLRRMGFNFIQNRKARPSEALGAMC